MDDKITIIEGPTPVFEESGEAWAIGQNESPNLYNLVLTRLRTFNGPALVERCYRTWREQDTMYLHFRNNLGMEEKAPIMAARTVKTGDGDMLLLWVRVDSEEEEETNEFDSGTEE